MGGLASCMSTQDLAFCRENTSFIPRMGLACAVCQIPARKDEDRYAANMVSAKKGGLVPLSGTCDAQVGDTVCLGIYDGHGGKGSADLLEARLHKNIFSYMAKSQGETQADSKNSRAESRRLEEMKVEGSGKGHIPTNKNIKDSYAAIDAVCKEQAKFCGSCAVDVFITLQEDGSRFVKCSWVGDSRAASFRDARYKRFADLTKDHNLLREDEKKRVIQHGKTHGGAIVTRRTNRHGEPVGPWAVFSSPPNEGNNLSLMMTRSIGDGHHSKAVIPEPEITEFVVKKDEHVRLVIASDGLWRVFQNKGVRKMLKHAPNPIRAANRLAVESVYRTQRHTQYKLDDVTIMVVDIVASVSEADTES
mmetsp:Transcript_21398/g.40089  ORF Transcript_21398/g.40089 Transcript_21398/m.40089 type:complete len:362 (-) Transcript_21398:474-1559(-)